jgi:hypothetical protein
MPLSDELADLRTRRVAVPHRGAGHLRQKSLVAFATDWARTLLIKARRSQELKKRERSATTFGHSNGLRLLTLPRALFAHLKPVRE